MPKAVAKNIKGRRPAKAPRKAKAPDPTFATVAEFVRASATYSDAIRRVSALEQSLPRDKTRWHESVDEPVPTNRTDAPEWTNANLEAAIAYKFKALTLKHMLNVLPTTLAGLRHLTAFVQEQSKIDDILTRWHIGKYSEKTGEPVFVDMLPLFLQTVALSVDMIAPASPAKRK